MEENIIRFHIAMHDVIFIENLKRFQKLLKDEQRILFWQFDLFWKKTFKSTTVAVLINKIKIIACFEHVVVSDDIWVSLNIGENVYLINSTLLQFFILFELVYRNDLYGIFFLVVVVYRSVNLTVNTRTDRFV